MHQNIFCVYMLTNTEHTALYTGVTNNLQGHMLELRAGRSSFAKKYKLTKLVYFECGGDGKTAFAREKQIRASPRPKKIELVSAQNPNWKDLFEELSG